MSDSSQPKECIASIPDDDCSFCGGLGIVGILYAKTGTVWHCLDCYDEYVRIPRDEVNYRAVELSTEVIHSPVDEIRHAV